MTTITTINAAGLEEIREFLIANHARPELFDGTDSAVRLNAWARDAEDSHEAGNGATIEIRAADSRHGRTQTYTVSPAGIITAELADE